MIYAISYANKRYQNALTLNLKMAIKYGKVDKVRGYTDKDLDEDFKEQNRELLSAKRGGGYWIWKPYIILDALKEVDKDDYVIYTDAASVFIDDAHKLIEALEFSEQSIACFATSFQEKMWTKRDTFVLMDCDASEYSDSNQILATYIIVKNGGHSADVIKRWSQFVLDRRMVSDDPNVLGKPNYEGFRENRHDQSIWSLMCKKEGLKPFADPSQWGVNREMFSEEIRKRSTFPQIIDSHRQRKFKYEWQVRSKLYQNIYMNLNPKVIISRKIRHIEIKR